MGKLRFSFLEFLIVFSWGLFLLLEFREGFWVDIDGVCVVWERKSRVGNYGKVILFWV